MLGRLRRLIAAPPSSEQRHLELDGHSLPYTLKRSAKRRSIGLRIDHRGLTVSMPSRAPESWLHRVLDEKSEWLLDKLGKWQAPPRLLWQDGASLPYRGRQITLRVRIATTAAAAELDGNELHLTLPQSTDSAHLEKRICDWYRQQALIVCRQRIAHYAAQMHVTPNAVRLSSARTRWGSCNSRGNVRLNWRLIQLSDELLDYVVIHELAHLREMNHSAAFWQVVEQACPDWQSRRARLRSWDTHLKQGV